MDGCEFIDKVNDSLGGLLMSSSFKPALPILVDERRRSNTEIGVPALFLEEPSHISRARKITQEHGIYILTVMTWWNNVPRTTMDKCV